MRHLLLLLLVACTKPNTPESPGSSPASAPAPTSNKETSMDQGQDWLGFAVYPSARMLCAEHISGNSMHIIWRSYASKAPPEVVVAFYKPGATEKKLELTGSQDTRLSVFPVSEAGDHPSCEEKASADEQTIIFVSQAIR